MVTMVLVVSRFRLKAPPGISSSCISPLTSSGQRSRASWAFQPQKLATLSPQPGDKPRKFIRTCGGIGEREKKKTLLPHICYISSQSRPCNCPSLRASLGVLGLRIRPTCIGRKSLKLKTKWDLGDVPRTLSPSD